MSTQPLSTHTPGPDGLFGGTARCGATPSTTATGSLRLSETFRDCLVCIDLEDDD